MICAESNCFVARDTPSSILLPTTSLIADRLKEEEASQNGFSTHEAGKPREHMRTTVGCFPRPSNTQSTFRQVTAPPRENS